MSKAEKAKFRRGFMKALDSIDEMLFGNMSTDDILLRFKTLGFWSCCSHRIFYDENTQIFVIQERRFG
jgi:hypothetical protein